MRFVKKIPKYYYCIIHVNYIYVSSAAYVRPLLDRNNKNKKKPPRTDAYRKPMDRNIVEYVIHITYLYIILYVQKRVRVRKYISPHIDVLVKKSIGKLFRVERASMDCKGSNNDDNINILPAVGQPKSLINWPKYMFFTRLLWLAYTRFSFEKSIVESIR